jgi:hypothetical protein
MTKEESESIEKIYYSSEEYKLIDLINKQADIYEYLAGQGDDDSMGIELAKQYTKLINEINLKMAVMGKQEHIEEEKVKFDPSLGEQLLERMSSRI